MIGWISRGIALGALFCVVGIGGPASADTITFDDLVPFAPVPHSYQGLNWSNFGVDPSMPDLGYGTGTISPPNVGLN